MQILLNYLRKYLISKLSFINHWLGSKIVEFAQEQGFALAREKLAEFSSLQSRYKLVALQSHLNVVF